MHHVQVNREIDRPAEAVWAVLDDFGGVSEIVSRKPRPTAAAQAKEYSHG